MMIQMVKLIGLLGVCLCVSLCSAVQCRANAAELPPLTLTDTAVVTLPDQHTGRSYELWFSLPSQFDRRKTYPVMVVSDAEYAFPLIRSIRKRLGAGGQNIEDFILVGLSYAKGDSSVDSRNRDYTPVNVKLAAYADGHDYGGRLYGQAAHYSRYITQQVLPYLFNNWPINRRKVIFVGHSYGALLGSQILFDAPQSFSHYVLSSPSYWFGAQELFKQEQRYASQHRDLAASVLFYSASFEQPGPSKRHNNKVSIVADTARMHQLLLQRHYPSLRVKNQVIDGEDHLSVYPRMISDAMLQLLPGRGPYSPG